jgi:hypothetical protein
MILAPAGVARSSRSAAWARRRRTACVPNCQVVSANSSFSFAQSAYSHRTCPLLRGRPYKRLLCRQAGQAADTDQPCLRQADCFPVLSKVLANSFIRHRCIAGLATGFVTSLLVDLYTHGRSRCESACKTCPAGGYHRRRGRTCQLQAYLPLHSGTNPSLGRQHNAHRHSCQTLSPVHSFLHDQEQDQLLSCQLLQVVIMIVNRPPVLPCLQAL